MDEINGNNQTNSCIYQWQGRIWGVAVASAEYNGNDREFLSSVVISQSRCLESRKSIYMNYKWMRERYEMLLKNFTARLLNSHIYNFCELRWVHCWFHTNVPMPPNHSGYNKLSVGYNLHSYNSWFLRWTTKSIWVSEGVPLSRGNCRERLMIHCSTFLSKHYARMSHSKD